MFDVVSQPEKTQQGVKRTKEAWFSKITRLFDKSTYDDTLWVELEEALIAADVGVSTTTLLLERTRQRARSERALEAGQVKNILQEEMSALLQGNGTRVAESQAAGQVILKPLVILVIGVNGTGKTTSIAKLTHLLQRQGKRVLLAAADTFRAAAIDQLKIWGERMGAEVIAHQPGADPGAVAFDAMQAARSRDFDVLIIDTAGRLHTKTNLMEELKKISRVVSRNDPAAPHQVLLVLDATTGQNGLIQARYFTEAVGVSGIFLAKLDGTAKGGIVLAIARELQTPILFIGTGEGLEDMAPFDAAEFAEALLS